MFVCMWIHTYLNVNESYDKEAICFSRYIEICCHTYIHKCANFTKLCAEKGCVLYYFNDSFAGMTLYFEVEGFGER